MSAIASFYLVRTEDVPALKQLAAEPSGPVRRRFLFFTYSTGEWHDPYWEFLFSNARKLEDFDWSGYVLGVEVDLYLRSRSIEMEAFCDRELLDHFSKARDGGTFIFQKEGAQKLLEALDANWPTEENLAAFLNSEEMKSTADDEPVPVQAMFDGLEVLKRWLSQVDDAQIGLLNIG